MVNWFMKLTGFEEKANAGQKLRSLLRNGTKLVLPDGRSYECGRLEVPTLTSLRDRCTFDLGTNTCAPHSLRVREVIGDVAQLHVKHPNAVFQVASQFNLLEMISPTVTPEEGVTRYMLDGTQGPACSIAVGAATIYRNYLAPMAEYPTTSPPTDGQLGQTETCQIDCLADLGTELSRGCTRTHQETSERLWNMQNGYALCTTEGLKSISSYLETLSDDEYDQLAGHLRIGVQSNAQVTASSTVNHTVTQVFCSALPVAYTTVPRKLWESFAFLILMGTYEATMYAALENYAATGNAKVFLTYVGGGVFGNAGSWIADAILQSLNKFAHTPLQVELISYGEPNPIARSVIRRFAGKKR